MINSGKIDGLPITPNQSSSVSISRSSTTPPIRNINKKTFADVPFSTPEQSSSISTEEETKLIEFAKAYQHQAVSSQVLEPKKVTTSFLLKHLGEKERKSVTSFLKNNNIPISDSTFVNMHFIGYIPESLSSKIINLVEVNGKYFEVNEERTYKSVDGFLKENNIGPGKFLFYDNNSKKVQTIDKAQTLGQKVDAAVTTAALVSLVVPAAVLGGAPAAGAIAFGTTVYFGARAVYTIADDLKHGVRSPLKFIKNAGWVMLGAGGLSGKAGKYALGLAAAGSKTEKAAQVVINLSKVGNIGGAVTILGSLGYEGGNGLKEIMDKDVPYDKKMEMIKYAAVQLGLMVVVTIKGKTFTLKDGKMPKELMPSKAVQLETDKILLKHGGGINCLKRIWENTVTKGKETVQAIENFYNTAKSAGKKAGEEAIKYLANLYSEGTQTLKDALIIFADRHKLSIIPERIQEFAFAGGSRIQQTGQIGLRLPTTEQVESARSRLESTGAYFASDAAKKVSASSGGKTKRLSPEQEKIRAATEELYAPIIPKLLASSKPEDIAVAKKLREIWGDPLLSDRQKLDATLSVLVEEGIEIQRMENSAGITEISQINPYGYWQLNLQGSNIRFGFSYKTLQELEGLDPNTKNRFMDALWNGLRTKDYSTITMNISSTNPKEAEIIIGDLSFRATLWPDKIYTIEEIARGSIGK